VAHPQRKDRGCRPIWFLCSGRSVDSLLSSKLKLGADASLAAGPVGEAAQVSTDVKLNAAIYAYSRSKGLFAGRALDGVVLRLDNSANRLRAKKDPTRKDTKESKS
jgi:lipid-binding SYLF domain-containing protein